MMKPVSTSAANVLRCQTFRCVPLWQWLAETWGLLVLGLGIGVAVGWGIWA